MFSIVFKLIGSENYHKEICFFVNNVSFIQLICTQTLTLTSALFSVYAKCIWLVKSDP